MSKPVLGKSRDGIYPRCVWCNGENYGPLVFPYSLGELNGCPTAKEEGAEPCPDLPKDYVTAKASK